MKTNIMISVITLILPIVSAHAQDIDTLIPKETGVTPNIVLILDNSLTMVNSVEGPRGNYDQSIDYGGPVNAFESSKCYYDDNVPMTTLTQKAVAELKSINISELGQNKISFKEELDSKGFATSEGVKYFTGNYLNWFYESRFNFAKRCINKLIENRTQSINFSVLRPDSYHNPEAFKGFVQDCGKGNCTSVHIRQIDGLSCPSAMERSLLETSAYFKEEKSIYEARKYSSTIRYWCQPNAVIIISDGLSSWRGGDIFFWPWSNPPEHFEDKGIAKDYLDDVAEKLYLTDLRYDLPANQNVRTYTAGFRSHAMFPSKNDILVSTALRGGGEFTELTDEKSLGSFLLEIENPPGDSASSGLTVPSGIESKSFSGEYAYFSMFRKITQDERWIGNIKKFRILSNSALDTKDVWTGNDSADAASGGVRQILLGTSSDDRKIYTNKTDSTALIEFKKSSFSEDELYFYDLTETLIDNIRCGGTCMEEKSGIYALGDIIHFVPIVNHYMDAGGNNAKTRIFAGGNDGMVHCFDDQTGEEKWAYIPDDQLKRLNLLTPEGHPSKAVGIHSSFADGGRTIFDFSNGKKLLIFGERRGGKNYYALDVSEPDAPKLSYRVILDKETSFGQSWTNPKVVPVIFGDSLKNVFWIGGGYDEENQEKENGPASEDSVGKGVYSIDAISGQKLDIIPGTDLSSIKNCILDPVSFNPGFTGGNAKTPVSKEQKEAHSRIYACDMGANLWGFRDDEIPDNTESVRGPGTKDGSWVVKKIFSGSSNPKRKAFSSPEIVLESFVQTLRDKNGRITGYVNHKGEYVYFGTGDREDPTYLPEEKEKEAGQERFYAIKNYWISGDDASVTENDLIDVTADSIQMSDDNAMKETLLSFDTRGWYLRLENPGEKVVSPPLAYNGMLFFTTYTPSNDEQDQGKKGKHHRHRNRYRHQEKEGGSGNNNANQSENDEGNGNGKGQRSDPCNGSDEAGTARLYCLNYKTGEAVLDLDPSSSVVKLRKDSNGNYIDENGKMTEKDNAQKLIGLHKNDRKTEIGPGMPGDPTLFFPKQGGSQIIVGINNNMKAFTLPVHDMHVFYWREKQ